MKTACAGVQKNHNWPFFPIKVSVIIPIYQSARFLQEALESIAQQTFFKKNPSALETLIIVDGVCEPFEDKIPDPLIKTLKIHKISHRGVSGARNYGLQRSKGAFVAFLDADDIWLPEKLEIQIAAMEQHPEAGMMYVNSYWIDKSGSVLSRTQKDQYGSLPRGRIGRRMIERDYPITSSVLIRQNVIDHVGLFDTTLEVCEDWEFKIRVAKQYPVLSDDTPLLYYRLHAGGSHYKCERMLECGYEVFDRHVKDFDVNGSLTVLKGNVPLNLAGSWLYIDRPTEARKYLKESMKWNKKNPKLYLMFLLSLFPKPARDCLLWIRDKVPFLP